MIKKEEIELILKKYDRKKLRIATLCSHSSLQIFNGAWEEGFRTIGIRVGENRVTYDAFPYAKPDMFITVEEFRDVERFQELLIEHNAILVPHGSLIEFVGRRIEELAVPILGNRKALLWENDRQKMIKWMQKAGLRIPKTLEPGKIDRPCIVKFPGAKGGRGYVVVKNEAEFERKMRERGITDEMLAKSVIQEYIVGIRFYPHYFYSLFHDDGFRVGEGRLELLGMDQRVEDNIDEIYRANTFGYSPEPQFTVVGNAPIVARESLLDQLLTIGQKTVDASIELFGGIPGPFCVETTCTENLEFYVFEISSRIVAGTNLFPRGSTYSWFTFNEPMSMGRRIAREIKIAAKKNALEKLVY
ncbi:MAG: formate--phosphoribosylaminoimidazolecarboxamide ligase [Candidatus Micrarchaeia archaeon]